MFPLLATNFYPEVQRCGFAKYFRIGPSWPKGKGSRSFKEAFYLDKLFHPHSALPGGILTWETDRSSSKFSLETLTEFSVLNFVFSSSCGWRMILNFGDLFPAKWEIGREAGFWQKKSCKKIKLMIKFWNWRWRLLTSFVGWKKIARRRRLPKPRTCQNNVSPRMKSDSKPKSALPKFAKIGSNSISSDIYWARTWQRQLFGEIKLGAS